MFLIFKEIKRLYFINNFILSTIWLILTVKLFSIMLKIYLIFFIIAWIKIILIKENGVIILNTFVGTCCFKVLIILNTKKNILFYLDIFISYLIVFIVGCSLKSIQLSLKFLEILKFSWITRENFFYLFIKDEFIFQNFTGSLYFYKKKINFKNNTL